MSLNWWKFTNITWKFFLFYLVRVILLYITNFYIVSFLDWSSNNKNLSLPFAITENRFVCLHKLTSIMAGFSNSTFFRKENLFEKFSYKLYGALLFEHLRTKFVENIEAGRWIATSSEDTQTKLFIKF